MILDPGAFTSLIGENLGREIVKHALNSGAKPAPNPMPDPLEIAGVGEGTQECKWSLNTPVACKHNDVQAHLHLLDAPVVQGSRADLPGLLGLDPLKANNAILDIGGKRLTYQGKGEFCRNAT